MIHDLTGRIARTDQQATQRRHHLDALPQNRADLRGLAKDKDTRP
jgi:hypothetical protein